MWINKIKWVKVSVIRKHCLQTFFIWNWILHMYEMDFIHGPIHKSHCIASLSSFRYCPTGPFMPRTHDHLTYCHHHCHHHWPHHHHIIIITSTTSLAETSWWRHVGTGNGEGVRRLPGRDGSHPYNHQPTYCTFWNCFSIVGDQTIGKSTIEWNEIFPY